MSPNEPDAGRRFGRRGFLAAAGTTAVTAAGCVADIRNIVGRDDPERVSLSIAALPAEADPVPIRIANRLRSNLQAIGIETSVDLLSLDSFRLDVLVNHDFDIAIARHSAARDPDFLYATLHSRFAPESGWQNPYGFTDLELDEALLEQRGRSGSARRAIIGEILERISREQPFNPIAFPIERRAYRMDRIGRVDGKPFDGGFDLYNLSTKRTLDAMTLALGDPAPTRNLNPLSVEFRDRGLVMGLLYDQLAVETPAGVTPWLASEIEWSDSTATITLREARWHDGETVTAEDVAFTYRYLADTSLGERDSSVPAPRYRGRIDLVDGTDVTSIRSLDITFDASRTVAKRALLVPILPRHIWRDRNDPAEIGGIEWRDAFTEGLVMSNLPPIGSGPYRYVDHEQREYLEFERVEDHFIDRIDLAHPVETPADELRFEVVPNVPTAIEGVSDGSYDLTLEPLAPDTDLDLLEFGEIAVANPPGFYHVAYNTRNRPLSNTNFRRVVSRLMDKQHLRDVVFEGHASVATTPIQRVGWVPEDLRWSGRDPEVPFFGEDGVLDAAMARDSLIEAGYRYDDEGVLLGRRR
ncbi:MAG: ABC transporter substrate-binding protein [Halobacteriota archaeon]